MAAIKSLVHKEILQMVRDPRTLLVAVVMPVVLLLLFGFAISMEVTTIRIVASADRPGQNENEMLLKLIANPYIDYKGIVAENEIEPLLRKGEVEAGIILREKNGKIYSHILVDASNSSMSRSYSAYISGIISGSGEQPVITSVLYNPALKSAYNFVPGILGMIFILICSIMTSVSIVREKETGTMSLMMVSPVRPATVIIGQLIPYLMLSCLILFLMLLISYTLLGLPFSGSVIKVVMISILYIILALSIGLLVSSIVDTQLKALIVSAILFMIPVIMLSGMIFPIANIPKILQWLSCVVPARWYVSAMRKIMIQDLSLEYISVEFTVLFGMTMAMLSLAIFSFKRKY